MVVYGGSVDSGNANPEPAQPPHYYWILAVVYLVTPISLLGQVIAVR